MFKRTILAATLVLVAPTTTMAANSTLYTDLISLVEVMGQTTGQVAECDGRSLRLKQKVRSLIYGNFSGDTADELYSRFRQAKLSEQARLDECRIDLIKDNARRIKDLNQRLQQGMQ